MINFEEGLTFDDVLLVPRYSKINSRSDVNLSVELSKQIKLNNPLIPANMKTITGIEMAEEIYKNKSMAILHRFEDYDKIALWANFLNEKYCKDVFNYIGFSVGVKKQDRELVEKLINEGVKIITVDIAHGDSENCVNMCKYISNNFPNVFLIAGNIATPQGARMLWRNGADAVKVNVGSGSICSTRIKTGNGYPALSCISNVYDSKSSLEKELGKKLFIIADGGCKSSGDLVKSLCFADLVMAGNLFAGAEETPGNILEINGKKYKEYIGSSTHKSSYIEGVASLVQTKNKVAEIMKELLEGIASGCSYQGVDNLIDLKFNPRFVKITNAGLKESHPHSVDIILK